MNVFEFRDRLVADCERFTRSFTGVKAEDIRAHIDQEYIAGRLWPAPTIQLNPAFVSGDEIGGFVAEGLLHPECDRIFRLGKTLEGVPDRSLPL